MSELPKHYGCVAATGVLSCVLVQALGINVGRARKKFEIPYPQMYSDSNIKFNCIQRAHQHTLEQHPTILFCLAVGGIAAPRTAAASCLIWMLGRVVFAAGYCTGDPAKRNWGVFGYLGAFGLYATTVAFALKKLGVIECC